MLRWTEPRLGHCDRYVGKQWIASKGCSSKRLEEKREKHWNKWDSLYLLRNNCKTYRCHQIVMAMVLKKQVAQILMFEGS